MPNKLNNGSYNSPRSTNITSLMLVNIDERDLNMPISKQQFGYELVRHVILQRHFLSTKDRISSDDEEDLNRVM